MMVDIEGEINELILKLQKELAEKEIIALVYNPLNAEGMKYTDCKFLKHILISKKYTSPLFLLNGRGGDFDAGIYFPNLIKQSVKNYSVYVPRVCCSSLCYTFFKAQELLVGENTSITQIDPKFPYKGEMRRAIKVMKDHKIKDGFLKERAREIFHLVEEQTKRLIEGPSLFREKGMEYYEFMHLDDLVTLFMNKGDHYAEISVKELERLGAKIKNLRGSNADNFANCLILKCQDFAIQNNVRAIFVSSVPIDLPGEKEGTFICPLT